MTFRAEPRARTLAFLATAAALVVATLGSVPAQAAGGSSITITDPAAAGALTAGAVTLGGQVFLDSTPATTTVLFAVDVSGSTNYPSGRDCNGDGVADGGDNINNDPVVGDLLDCELAAVRALDSYLTQFAGSVLVGLEAFAGTAETANLSPDSPTTFIPPGYTGGDATSRMQFVTHNVVRNLIKKYPPAIELDATQTNFDAAVDRALSALSTAAAGPKYVILTSDVVKEGNVPGSMARPISQDRLDRLAASGVHMRTFSLGGSAGCDPGTSLARMAAVTGETCTPIVNPSTLQTSFLSGAPPAIRDVTVSVGGMSVAADTDAIGNWRTQLQLGQGSYTVRATARLTAGGSVSAERVITVGPAALGTDPATVPAPGTVGLSPETRVATVVTARRPRPLRAALPRTVTGRVAQTGQALGTTTGLNSASVLLQGRAATSSQW